MHTSHQSFLAEPLFNSCLVSYVGHALGSAVSPLVPEAWPAEWPLQCCSFQTEITAASCLVCQYVPGQLLTDFHTLFSCRPRFVHQLVCVTASGSAFIGWLARRVLVSYWPFSTAPRRPCMDRVAWRCAACSTARPRRIADCYILQNPAEHFTGQHTAQPAQFIFSDFGQRCTISHPPKYSQAACPAVLHVPLQVQIVLRTLPAHGRVLHANAIHINSSAGTMLLRPESNRYAPLH